MKPKMLELNKYPLLFIEPIINSSLTKIIDFGENNYNISGVDENSSENSYNDISLDTNARMNQFEGKWCLNYFYNTEEKFLNKNYHYLFKENLNAL